MKIAIDVSKLNEMSKKRGIGFYAQHLVEALRKYTDNDIYLVEESEDMSKFALIHYPYFDFFNPTLKVDKNIPTVVTVHDVIPLIFPEHYPPGVRGKVKNFIQKQSLKKVSAIITDSEASRKDISKYLKIDDSKIHVVYLSASEKFKKITTKAVLEKIQEKYKLPKKFVLFTGSTNWNKNLLNMTQAAIASENDIVFVGKAFENRENLGHAELKSFGQFLEKYESHPLVHILGFVSDEDIVSLYNLAEALLLPSFYEGFGLTILEAQSCGVPVITSNNSSMKEVAGDGAILVDPSSIDEIKDQILNIKNDKELRKSLIKKGLENVKRFSWEKAAKETTEVYVKVISK
jgi:glycosyltransferase involved in cell wall biosynthesis